MDLNVFFKSHYDFITKILEEVKNEENIITIIPTLTFLVFTFLLVHFKVHRCSGPFTSLKVYLYREILFQWMYFYITRAWIFCIECNTFVTKWCENRIENWHNSNKFVYLNSQHINAISFIIMTSISMVPLYLFLVKCMWRRHIPNFLMWIGDDPWARSEIGLSGHFLDRPPNFILSHHKMHAYRSKRSSSVEQTGNLSIQLPLRNSKSLSAINRRKSFDAFIQRTY